MPIIIGLLILIVLLILFGPWLLVAIGVVISVIVAAIAWAVKTLLVPVGIVLLIGLALAILAFSVLSVWVGIDRMAASPWLTKLRRRKITPERPLPPLAKTKPHQVRPTRPWDR